MSEEKKQQDTINADVKHKLEDHSKQLSQHLEILGELGKKCKDNRTYCDKLQEKSEKAFKKIEDLKNDMFQHVSNTKEDLKERLGDLDKLYTE